jgi:hypothetical protein
MTSLLIAILITAPAITYVIEFVELITFGMFGVPTLNKYLALPLSAGALWLLHVKDLRLIVATPAASLIAIMISRYINKPTVASLPRLRSL